MDSLKIITLAPVNSTAKHAWVADQLACDKMWISSQYTLNIMENSFKLKNIVHAEIDELIQVLRRKEQELCQEIDTQSFGHCNDIEAHIQMDLCSQRIVRGSSLNPLSAKHCIAEGSTQNFKELPSFFKKQVVFISNFNDLKARLQSFGEVKIGDYAVETEEKEEAKFKHSLERNFAKMKQCQLVEIGKELADAPFEIIQSDIKEIQKLEEELLTDEDDIDFISETESAEIPSWQPNLTQKGKTSDNLLMDACFKGHSPTKEKNLTECFLRMMRNLKKMDEPKKCMKSKDAKLLSDNPKKDEEPKKFEESKDAKILSERNTETSAEPLLQLQKQLKDLKMSKKSIFLISDNEQSIQFSKEDREKNSEVKTPICQEGILPPKSRLFPSAEFFSHFSRKESNSLHSVLSNEENVSPWELTQSSFSAYFHEGSTEKWLHSGGGVDKSSYLCKKNL